MSRADFDKWQGRYAADDLEPGTPEPFVVETASRLASGRALDLAGGLGRHALALAAAGWSVTLADVSPAGLAHAQRLAAQRGLSLRTEAVDLDAAPPPTGPFDLVVVSWFLLTETMWPGVLGALAPGGSLVYVQPTLRNLERHPHPSRRFLVEPGDLAHRAEAGGLTVMRVEIGWDAHEHHTERLWARHDG